MKHFIAGAFFLLQILLLQGHHFLWLETLDSADQHVTLFNGKLDKKSLIEALDSLEDVIKRPKKTKKSPEKFPLVAKKERGPIINANKLEEDLEVLIQIFFHAFYDAKSSFDDVQKAQMNMAQFKSKYSLELSAIDTWSIRLLYYFVIYEHLTIDFMAKTKRMEDLGITLEDRLRINQFIVTNKFLDQIYRFKGENHEAPSINAQEMAKDSELSQYEGKNFRDVASSFIDPDKKEQLSLEQKIMEMDYSAEEVQEMIDGHNDERNQ